LIASAKIAAVVLSEGLEPDPEAYSQIIRFWRFAVRSPRRVIGDNAFAYWFRAVPGIENGGVIAMVFYGKVGAMGVFRSVP